jgi:hypothetical protein
MLGLAKRKAVNDNAQQHRTRQTQIQNAATAGDGIEAAVGKTITSQPAPAKNSAPVVPGTKVRNQPRHAISLYGHQASGLFPKRPLFRQNSGHAFRTVITRARLKIVINIKDI